MFQLGNDEESLPAVCFLRADHVPVDVIPKVEDVRTLSSCQLTEQITVPTTVHFSLLWRDCQVCGTCWIVRGMFLKEFEVLFLGSGIKL